MLITSVHNAKVKEAARLRDRRARKEQGRIVIDGAREVARALAGNLRLQELFWCEDLCPSDEARDARRLTAAAGADVWDVTPEVFAKLAFGERAEGILAIAETPHTSLSDLRLPEMALVAVIEGLEKPGNLGAVLRSADAVGVHAVIVADGRTDLYNPNAIRASLGTIFTLPVCEATSAETLHWLRDQDLNIYAARVDAERAYMAADFSRGSAIVLGSEAAGLSSVWQGPDVTPIALPMQGVADSLNISATAAVLFYEALRQRAERPEN